MKEQQYIYEKCSGRRRKASVVECDYCKNKFLKADKEIKNTNKHFCNIKCRSLAEQKRIICVCHICGKNFERVVSRVNSSKSGLVFCSRECKEYAQSIEGDCKEIQPPHYNNGICSYKPKMSNELKEGCCDCGEKRLYYLNIHHIDGDRTNNIRNNLEVVCVKCHCKRHLKFVEESETWVFDGKYLTPRDILSKL